MSSTSQKSTRKPRRMARSADLAIIDHGDNAVVIDGEAADMPRAEESGNDGANRISKQAIILDLLRRKEGTLLADIVAATGWQPHTARAALSGLRKKGQPVVSTKVDKLARYSLA